MKTFDQVVELLVQQLDQTRIAYRDGGGRDGQVPYLEGHDIISKANEIFDFRWSFKLGEPVIREWQQILTRWDSNERARLPVLDKEGNQLTKWAGIVYVTGEVSVTIGDEVYSHGDLGRSAISTDSPESLDTALAGAATDCLKRCFRQLGNQFGNQLYDKEYRSEELDMPVQSAKPAQKQPQKPAQKLPQKPPPKPAPKPAPKEEAPAPEAKSVEPSLPEKLQYTLDLLIPAGVPLAGKTFKEALDHPMGKTVVRWLCGDIESPQGKKVYKPANVADEKVMEAAKELTKELGL